jgi:hypothetical protein
MNDETGKPYEGRDGTGSSSAHRAMAARVGDSAHAAGAGTKSVRRA